MWNSTPPLQEQFIIGGTLFSMCILFCQVGSASPHKHNSIFCLVTHCMQCWLMLLQAVVAITKIWEACYSSLGVTFCCIRRVSRSRSLPAHLNACLRLQKPSSAAMTCFAGSSKLKADVLAFHANMEGGLPLRVIRKVLKENSALSSDYLYLYCGKY